MDPVDDLAFVVGLAERDLEAAAGGEPPAQLLDIGERLVTVDVGLTHAEQVQVRPVQDVDPLAHRLAHGLAHGLVHGRGAS